MPHTGITAFNRSSVAAGVQCLVASSGCTGDGQPAGINFGTRDQVIDGSPVVIDLKADQRRTDRKEGCPDQSAVVRSGPGINRPLSRTEGVHTENNVTELCQADAPRLYVDVHASPGPVSVH